MKVNDIQNVVHGLDAHEILKQRADRTRPPESDQSSKDGDKLEISLSAKITNEYSTDQAANAQQPSEMNDQRIAEIRARIAAGSYDNPAALNALAQKIRDFYTS